MRNKKINGNDLIALGYSTNQSIGVALKINKKRLGYTRAQLLARFKDVLDNPGLFMDDAVFRPLAAALTDIERTDKETVQLNTAPDGYKIYGDTRFCGARQGRSGGN